MLLDNNRFSTTLPILVLIRAEGETDWQEFDRGPGYFTIPEGMDVCIKVKLLNDTDLQTLAGEIAQLACLRMLDMAENRKITDEGLKALKNLPQLTELNLGSCDITKHGLEHLADLPHLKRLNLAYCGRLTGTVTKPLRQLARLEYLDLLGCLHIPRSSVAKIERRGLTIRV